MLSRAPCDSERRSPYVYIRDGEAIARVRELERGDARGYAFARRARAREPRARELEFDRPSKDDRRDAYDEGSDDDEDDDEDDGEDDDEDDDDAAMGEVDRRASGDDARALERERERSSASANALEREPNGRGDKRYTREFLLRFRSTCVDTPQGVEDARLGAYPWRARTSARMTDDREDDDACGDVSIDVRERTLWRANAELGGECEQTFASDRAAARVVVERESKRAETRASATIVVEFRPGAVRAFVREVVKTHYASFARDARRGANAIGIVYGTSRASASGRSRVDAAFVHPWDGDVAHVLSWLATPRETELIAPVGWVCANAALGVGLAPGMKRAYDAAAPGETSAARVFANVDVVTSASGAIAMECYDMHTGETLGFVLSGEDAETSLVKLGAEEDDGE